VAGKPGLARAFIDNDAVRFDLQAGDDALDESTRFEIGSIVKTLTATLLASVNKLQPK